MWKVAMRTFRNKIYWFTCNLWKWYMNEDHTCSIVGAIFFFENFANLKIRVNRIANTNHNKMHMSRLKNSVCYHFMDTWWQNGHKWPNNVQNTSKMLPLLLLTPPVRCLEYGKQHYFSKTWFIHVYCQTKSKFMSSKKRALDLYGETCTTRLLKCVCVCVCTVRKRESWLQILYDSNISLCVLNAISNLTCNCKKIPGRMFLTIFRIKFSKNCYECDLEAWLMINVDQIAMLVNTRETDCIIFNGECQIFDKVNCEVMVSSENIFFTCSHKLNA